MTGDNFSRGAVCKTNGERARGSFANSKRGEERKGIIVVTEKKLKFVQRSQNTPKLGGWTDGGLRKRIGQTASTECDPYDENLTTPSYA